MAFRAVGRVAPTKGYLIKLRKTVAFLRVGAETLEMKRDKLIKELRSFLDRLKEREELERELLDAYAMIKVAYSTSGSGEMAKAALLSDRVLVETKTRSVMGLEIPEAKVPQLGFRPSPALNSAVISSLNRLQETMNKLVQLTMLEATLEKLASEVADTMRRVNTLKKVIIPGHEAAIKYIEETLEGESLEDFLRIKKYKDIKRGA